MKRFISVVVLMLFMLVFGVFLGTRLDLSGEGRPGKQKKILEAYGLIKQFYVDEVDGDSLAGAGVEGMADFLDPHTVYLDPEKASYSQAELDGNFDGIGIELDIINDTLFVVTPLSGGPSASIGISAGDRIIAIDSVSAVGISSREALEKLRGKRGTKVRLKVLRPLSGKVLEFLVARGKISTSSIDAAFMIDNRVGYIRLSRFMATTAVEFHSALALLKKQGMERLVLDVRGNPGGFLGQVVEVADEFLTKGQLIVYTKSRNGGAKEERYIATSGGIYEKGDLVVLVDKGSASASEILAGALQDNKRAVVVGELSFGKGLVQCQFSFTDGSALRLTVSRYYTPSGRQIQRLYRKGVAGRNHYFRDGIINIHPEKLLAHPKSFLFFRNSDVTVYKTTTLPFLVASLKGGKGDGLSALSALKDAGGVIPDYWATGRLFSGFYQSLYQSGAFDDIARKLLDNPRSSVQRHRVSMERFIADYSEDDGFEALVVKTCKLKKITFNRVAFILDRKYIARAVKLRIAHQLFGTEGQVRFFVQGADPLVKIAATVPVSQP